MPGFRPENKLYKLTFEETDFDGLVVRVGCCSVGEFNTALVGDPEKRLAENNAVLFELFLKYLDSWNLEEHILDADGRWDGESWQVVPYTVEGINRQDAQMMSSVIGAWQRAMIGISPNLRRPSNDGETSLESELELASSSESLPN